MKAIEIVQIAEIVQVETYTGTLESLENVIKNLKLYSEDYHFDVLERSLCIFKMGIIYYPGDSYHYTLSQ